MLRAPTSTECHAAPPEATRAGRSNGPHDSPSTASTVAYTGRHDDGSAPAAPSQLSRSPPGRS